MKEIIQTKKAPNAIGAYSQSVKVGNFLFISGQIPINPDTGLIDSVDFKLQARQVFNNLLAIVNQAQANNKDIVKINAYLTDLDNFSTFNDIMIEYINAPFPARAVVGVSSLPKNAKIEVEAIVYIKDNM